jgi:hypothetical protein
MREYLKDRIKDLAMNSRNKNVRFEVFMVVTKKNTVFWDVSLCGSCRNRRFGGTSPPASA